MKGHEFIYSKAGNFRIFRHLMFWIAWWLFFAMTMFPWWVNFDHFVFSIHPGLREIGLLPWSGYIFSKAFLFLIPHIVACYLVLYLTLPRFLIGKNYPVLILSVFIMAFLLLVSGIWIQGNAIPRLNSWFHLKVNTEASTMVWSGVSASLLSAPKVIAVAVAIKLLKRWWAAQREKELLERAKMNAELQLLKSQIHPEFLFDSLKNILFLSEQSSSLAPQMMLRLSDILSYMLYECEESLVPLEKEVEILKSYMMMEKSRFGADFEMTAQFKIDTGNFLIVPLILISFLENSFAQCANKKTEKPWINLDLSLLGGSLEMKLINGKAPEEEIKADSSEAISKIRKRLEFHYGQKYELLIRDDGELSLIILKLMLDNSTAKEDYSVSDLFANQLVLS